LTSPGVVDIIVDNAALNQCVYAEEKKRRKNATCVIIAGYQMIPVN
jgi:hypothetical protein